jgi:hypothetical protein
MKKFDLQLELTQMEIDFLNEDRWLPDNTSKPSNSVVSTTLAEKGVLIRSLQNVKLTTIGCLIKKQLENLS